MKVLIIGAGIAGLTAAHQLHKHNIDVTIVEARSRIGGRILTFFPPNRLTLPLDYGSSWFQDEHKHVKKMIRELRLKRFLQSTDGLAIHDYGAGKTPQQFTPQPSALSYRLVGGMQTLIDKLQKRLPPDTVHLDTLVTQLSSDTDGIIVSATQNDNTVYYDSDYVIITVPPIVASTSIAYHPDLPLKIHQVLRSTPAWMGQVMKVFLVYDSPFWRKMGLSGRSISPDGIVNEFYDASPEHEPFGVLVGLLDPNSRGYNMLKPDRKQAIITQIKRLYGWQSNEIKYYGEINWAYESYTTERNTIGSYIDDHALYGHPILQQPTMNGRLFWGGSEVSTVSGGYMEGAVYRASEIAEAIIMKIKKA